MPWCCEDETTAASEEMLEWAKQGSELHVPSLWVWEILNVVAVTVKRQRLTPDRAGEFSEAAWQPEFPDGRAARERGLYTIASVGPTTHY